MSPSKNNHSSSNRNGESVGRPANILASAYCVDTSARLTGFHYSTTGAGGAQCPPLAALTSANELALSYKSKSRDNDHNGRRKGSRKEGAAYYIRGECERLFCETMKDVFLGEEETSSSNSSIGMGAGINRVHSSEKLSSYSQNYQNSYFGNAGHGQSVDAWLEVWDYAGGCSFRGFVGGKGEDKALFAFFNSAIIGRDLKQGLMALIELAEEVFAVSQVVVCVDRSVPDTDRKAFLKSLRWVGFDLIPLDLWSNGVDDTSDRWLFLGMEI
ncbi:ornithine decarboxylase antizyme [Tricladium varicosporioides]|nr:ornithine decarboxylase antizyme [Hymenoscyphus varicosporioides]